MPNSEMHAACSKHLGAFECRHYPAGARARIGRVSGADGGDRTCADRTRSGRTGRANPERDCGSGADRTPALSAAGKKGLSLVNGTPYATDVAIMSHARVKSLTDWAVAAAALGSSVLVRQSDTFT